MFKENEEVLHAGEMTFTKTVVAEKADPSKIYGTRGGTRATHATTIRYLGQFSFRLVARKKRMRAADPARYSM